MKASLGAAAIVTGIFTAFYALLTYACGIHYDIYGALIVIASIFIVVFRSITSERASILGFFLCSHALYSIVLIPYYIYLFYFYPEDVYQYWECTLSFAFMSATMLSVNTALPRKSKRDNAIS